MTPIQELKEENMLLRKGLQEVLDKLNEVHFDSVKTLQRINEQEKEYDKYKEINNMYDVDHNYMMRTGRYAWGERGKQIAGFYIRPIIEKYLKRLK